MTNISPPRLIAWSRNLAAIAGCLAADDRKVHARFRALEPGLGFETNARSPRARATCSKTTCDMDLDIGPAVFDRGSEPSGRT
jgi:hypothetical protein